MIRNTLSSIVAGRGGFGVAGAARRVLSTYPYELIRIPKPAALPVSTAQAGQPLTALAFARQGDDGSGIARSKIIGWLKNTSDSNAAESAESADSITPQAFVENSEFSQLVEHVLAKHVHEDPELQAQAAIQKSGWMNVVDGRNPPPLGRTASAEDIFGCVLVEDKAIQQGTFQANWAHRPVTRDGLFQLPRFIHSRLLGSLNSPHEN